jgi:hypothetical protein
LNARSTPAPGYELLMVTSRSASGNGSGRSSTALTTLKIVALAPMQAASVRMVVSAKPFCFQSRRRPNLTSWRR